MSAARPQGEMVESCRALVAAAEQTGLDVGPILADLGIRRDVLADPEQRLALDTCGAIWDRLIEATGDPDLPLRAVELSPFGNFLVIDFLGASGGTIGGGIQALARYFHVVHAHLRLRHAADGPNFCIEVDGPAQQGGDFALAMTLSRFNGLTSGGCVPFRVHLRRPPTRNPELAARLFGHHIAWNSAETIAWLDAATWQRVLPQTNPLLARVLARQAESMGPPIETSPIADRARGVIRRQLAQGSAEIQSVAPQLGLSVRTLQRRLADEGAVYQQLVEGERRRAAEAHLVNPSLSLVEVALLVGYADETAFHRAFQRWHGTSPSRWRRGFDRARTTAQAS